MSLKTMLLLGSLLPLLALLIDLYMARKYFAAVHDIKGWEATRNWLNDRRPVLGGAAVIYLVVTGVLLYTNEVRIPGLRHESDQYLKSAGNYLKAKKYKEAVLELRNAVKANPEDTEAYLLLARSLTQIGQGRDAVESYRKVISIDGARYEPHLELSRLAFAMRESALAVAEAAEAAKLQPDKAEPHLLLSQIHDAAGKDDLSRQECRAIAGKEFAALEFRKQFINLLLKQRSFAEALQATEAGRNIAPNDISLKIKQADALAGLGRHADAEATLLAATLSDPVSSVPWSALAHHRMDRGEYVGALRGFEEALKRAPDDDLIMNNIATLTAEHGFDLARAASLASRLYMKHPRSATVADTLGWTLFLQGKADLALPLLKQGVAGIPGNPLHRYHLGASLMKVGKQGAGRKELAEALRISGTFDGAARARALLRGEV